MKSKLGIETDKLDQHYLAKKRTEREKKCFLVLRFTWTLLREHSCVQPSIEARTIDIKTEKLPLFSTR